LKQFSQIQARTSSWRSSKENFTENVERLSRLNSNGSFIEKDVEGVEDPSQVLARDSKLVTMNTPPHGNEGNYIDEIQVDGEDVVLLDQHAFDGPNDVGGVIDEAKQMKEAKEMAEAMRLEQVPYI
jgi:hypothetical protein